MADRFFLETPIADGLATLGNEQAHHLTKVMRAKVGDQIGLFDGKGVEYEAQIVAISKKSASLEVISSQSKPDLTPELTIAVALPKGDRQKFLVEKLVELGANKLIPLGTKRGVAVANAKAIDRIKKQVVEATKQCRRSHLMKVGELQDVKQLIEKSQPDECHLFLADPYSKNKLSEADLQDEKQIIIAIGPEGGFSNAENESFVNSSWQPISFSPNVLRIETAAVSAIAILRS